MTLSVLEKQRNKAFRVSLGTIRGTDVTLGQSAEKRIISRRVVFRRQSMRPHTPFFDIWKRRQEAVQVMTLGLYAFRVVNFD